MVPIQEFNMALLKREGEAEDSPLSAPSGERIPQIGGQVETVGAGLLLPLSNMLHFKAREHVMFFMFF